MRIRSGDIAPATDARESETAGRRRPRMRAALWLALAGVTAAVAAVWWLTRDPNTLLARSRRVGPHGIRPLAWVSDDAMIGFRGNYDRAYLLDVKTGREAPLSELTARLGKLPKRVAYKLGQKGTPRRSISGVAGPQIEVSPDGQWLLWAMPVANPPDGQASYQAVRIDGSRVVSWSGPPAMQGEWYWAQWRPDSKHWLRLRVFPPDGLESAVEYAVEDSTYKNKVALQIFSFDFAPTGNTGRCYTRDGAGEPGQNPFRMRSISGRPGEGWSGEEDRLNIPTPEGEIVRSVDTAWRSDRLLLEGVYREPVEASWLTVRLRNLTGALPGKCFIWWTCRTDGSDLREVGRVRQESSIYKHIEPDPIRLMGMSLSGRRLAFYFRDDLYVTDLP